MFTLVDDVEFHEDCVPKRNPVQPVLLSPNMLASMERTRKLKQLACNSDFYKPLGGEKKWHIKTVDLFDFRCEDNDGNELVIKISAISKGDVFYRLEPMPVIF
jgi:hypothetical protein